MLKSYIPDNSMEPSARSSLTGINQPHLNSYQTRETVDQAYIKSEFDNLDIKSPIPISKKPALGQSNTM